MSLLSFLGMILSGMFFARAATYLALPNTPLPRVREIAMHAQVALFSLAGFAIGAIRVVQAVMA